MTVILILCTAQLLDVALPHPDSHHCILHAVTLMSHVHGVAAMSKMSTSILTEFLCAGLEVHVFLFIVSSTSEAVPFQCPVRWRQSF